jgi:putative two-component system response regulator
MRQNIMKSEKDLFKSRLDFILRMGQIFEYQDRNMGGHGIKVACYSKIIAEALNFDKDLVEEIFISTPLHDIGLIKIPDSILLKKEILSFEEWDLLREHCKIGADIISQKIEGMNVFYTVGKFDLDKNCYPGDDPFLSMASKIALTHHEWWNGKGYPDGLSKQDIPLESRVVAYADAYDELTSERPYRPAIPEDQALEKMKKNVGIQFDPDIYSGFEKSIDKLGSIRKQFLQSNKIPT